MPIVLTDQGEFSIPADHGLNVTPAVAQQLTGWALKPEGLCRDDLCVPVPPGLRGNNSIDLAAFWSLLGHPVISHDDTYVLGTAAVARTDTLAGLEAPDFTLPDLDGTLHSLSDFRGKKVFLTTWASW